MEAVKTEIPEPAAPPEVVDYPALLSEAILVAGSDGLVTASHGWAEVTGLPDSAALGDGWLSALEPPGPRTAHLHLAAALTSNRAYSGEGRLTEAAGAGPVRWCMRPIPGPGGHAAGVVVALYAIPGDAYTLAEAAALAELDPVARGPQQARFHAYLRHALLRLREHGGRLAVLHVRLQAPGGGRLRDLGPDGIASVVGRFRAVLPPVDVVVCTAPHDVFVLCEELALVNEGRATAIRLGRALSAPIVVDGRSVAVEAAVGIAVTDDASVSPGVLSQRASEAMERSRQLGRGPVSNLVRVHRRGRRGLAVAAGEAGGADDFAGDAAGDAGASSAG